MRRRLSLPSLRPEFPQASFPLVCLSLIQLAPNAVSPVPQKSILLRVISLKQGSNGALQNHNLQSQVQTLWRNWILADHSSAASHAPILASGNKTTDRPPRTPRGGSVSGRSSFCWQSFSFSPPRGTLPIPRPRCDVPSPPHCVCPSPLAPITLWPGLQTLSTCLVNNHGEQ